MCNKDAGKIGDLVHLDSIWQKLNFDQLKLSRSKVGILLLWFREVAIAHSKIKHCSNNLPQDMLTVNNVCKQ